MRFAEGLAIYLFVGLLLALYRLLPLMALGRARRYMKAHDVAMLLLVVICWPVLMGTDISEDGD